MGEFTEMKLIRFGERGKEKPGLLLKDGSRVDASALGSDYDEAFFAGGGLAKLESWLDKNSSSAPRSSACGATGISRLPAQQDHLHRAQLSRSMRRRPKRRRRKSRSSSLRRQRLW